MLLFGPPASLGDEVPNPRAERSILTGCLLLGKPPRVSI
jgi:hypothetical protein